MKRRLLPAGLRRAVILRDGRRCQYCGVAVDFATCSVDHLRPVALGGRSEASNLVAACFECNQLKADALPLEFLWVFGVRFHPQPKPKQHHPRLSTAPVGAEVRP